MGIATVITSGKGGVGKSTAAVGIGRALARRGRTMVQYKPVQLLRDEESRRFFAAAAAEFEGMRER